MKDIQQTILKLERLANHPNTPKHEAASAMMRIGELKEKYFKPLPKLYKNLMHWYERERDDLLEVAFVLQSVESGKNTTEINMQTQTTHFNSFKEADQYLRLHNYKPIDKKLYF